MLFLLLRGYLLPLALKDSIPSAVDPRLLVARAAAMVNAIMIVPFIILYLMRKIAYTTWCYSLAIVKGYLLAAMILDVYIFGFSADTLLALLHHTLYFTLLMMVARRNMQYSRIVAQCMLSEIPMPFVYYAWYLLRSGQNQGLLFLFCSLAACLGLLIFRVINFTYVLRCYAKKRPKLESLVFAPLWVYNCYLFFYVTNMLWETVM